MIRGTTPTHTFLVNVDMTDAKIYLTYKQNGRTIVEKTEKDMVVFPDRLVVDLTQAETLRFTADAPIEMQIRYVKGSGEASASEIMSTNIGNVLKQGVIE